MNEKLSNPVVYAVDGLVIDLDEVAVVICAVEDVRVPSPPPTCRVILRSGVSFTVDMRYSRSLTQAVEWSRSPGSVVRPKDGSPGDGYLVSNAWSWDDQKVS